MRTLFVATALTGFVALAALDLTAGSYRTGVASIMLAVANGLLLTV